MAERKKILLIDDEKDFCFFIKKNLEDSGGFDVVYTTDPMRGIKIAQQESPNLILLDIMMPGKDGFAVLEALKNDPRTISIPVVMLTAVEDDSARVRACRLSDEDYINKPVSYVLLKKKINEVLNRYGALKRAGNA